MHKIRLNKASNSPKFLALVLAGFILASCTGDEDPNPGGIGSSVSAAASSNSTIVSSVSSVASQSSSAGLGIPSTSDDDLDGVVNSLDVCANTAASDISLVDSDGCSPAQRGRQVYVLQCQGCHGVDGGSVLFGSITLDPLNDRRCSSLITGDCNLAGMAAYIADAMPYNTAASCTDRNGQNCATDVSSYIFRELVPAAGANDSDADGISDGDDRCPNTEPEFVAAIDSTGCKNITSTEEPVIAVNAGGPRFTAANGTVFLADDDRYHSASRAAGGNTLRAIANTQDDKIYSNHRWASTGNGYEYFFTVPNGSYKVVFHFAELDHEAEGLRKFNVKIEGNTVLRQFDIFKEAGGRKNAAVMRTSGVISVTDDKLDIQFINKTHKSSVSALEILRYEENDGDSDGIADIRDSCPGTIVAAAIDTNGCSDVQRDRDNDGILVPEDACPGTPIGEIASIDRDGNLAGCSERERSIDLDSDGVADVIDACPDSSPGEGVGETGCSGIRPLSNVDAVSPQLRLIAPEYLGTVKKAFDVSSLPEVTLLDDKFGPFSVYSNNADDQTADFVEVVNAAIGIAKGLSGTYARRCNWGGNAQRCVKDHLEDAMKVLYRQNTIANRDLRAIAQVVESAISNSASIEQAVTSAIARLLVDDRFLYQTVYGDSDTVAPEMDLKPREFASRLAYFLTDLPPSADIMSSLAGVVSNQSAIESHTDTMMSTDDYKEVVRLFISQWLNLLIEAEGGRNDLKPSAVRETREFLRHIIENNLPLSEMFTADYSFINNTLADHYGVPRPSTAWALYTFPPRAKRQGILTQASFLIGNGDHGRDINNIFRGKVIFERLFCEKMQPPPEDAAAANESISDRTVAPGCKSCHEVVDPIGYVFDLYDDNGKMYPGGAERSGGIALDVDIHGQYDNALLLSESLANSKAVNHCFTRQLYRFALGRDPVVSENDSFLSVRNELDAGRPLSEVIKAFVVSRSFKKVYAKTELRACPVGI